MKQKSEYPLAVEDRAVARMSKEVKESMKNEQHSLTNHRNKPPRTSVASHHAVEECRRATMVMEGRSTAIQGGREEETRGFALLGLRNE